eukprot:scaffold344754_cov40-Prasinocladus_malaysianus.AAC.1
MPVAAVACLCMSTAVPAFCAEEVTFEFKASTDPEIRRAQETLVEGWAYAGFYYLDDSKIEGL